MRERKLGLLDDICGLGRLALVMLGFARLPETALTKVWSKFDKTAGLYLDGIMLF